VRAKINRSERQFWRIQAPHLTCLMLGFFTAGACLPAESPAAAAEMWESWGTETYRLEEGESFQFRVAYEQIPVRAWRLVVDGDYILSDLHILRLRDRSLLYFVSDESHHDVPIPWGQGEEILVMLTASRAGGVYTVDFLGPPPPAAPASYSYTVNRALESYAAGKRLEAERLCQEALEENPRDGVAQVLLAGFLRDRHYFERALTMIEEALAADLPEDMDTLARQLRAELVELLAPLPESIRQGLARAEQLLDDSNEATALAECDLLLTAAPERSPEAHSRILQIKGRALHRLGRNFEAVDAFTKALTAARSRQTEAVIYFHMGQLFLDMDNWNQAAGAFAIARKYGLPAGLELQAAEAMQRIENRE
jgi:tetratricopeptide (TPR) repeat protein